ncbi:MAG: 16S rRNA (cytosine(1402)-N(4))-methyltransferase RsmH [Chloroflexia bacterium]|nr:16S rRNA (cytosine(1402)-N(4))-methyltransferase RsmH [Chloroflexia bacterium]
MAAPYEHEPVLYEAVLEALALQGDGRYIDGTVGAGGHGEGILRGSAPDGRLLGLDLDPQALALARQRLAPFGERACLVQGNFAHLGALARQHEFVPVQGVLLDLGLSSLQLDRAERGFSFQLDGPLDMRFNPAEGPSAADLVNELEEEELADLIWRYGEERQARRIAQRIVQARREEPLRRTLHLAQLVQAAVPRKRGRIHPATRTFMALRIAVNRELENLAAALEQAVEILAPGGHLAVISFHSLEDRMVKQAMRREEGRCQWPTERPLQECPYFRLDPEGGRSCRSYARAYCDLPARLRVVGKLLQADAEEIAANPRARSAKLRVAERLAA